MPTIGAGKHRYPENIVLNIIKEEVERISSIHDTQICLKNVSVIVYKEGKPSDKTSISSDVFPVAPQIGTLAQSTGEHRDHIGKADKIQLHFVGYKYDVENAISEVKSFIESNKAEKTIENVGGILQKHWSEVESISNSLFIKCPATGDITVQGMKDDVTDFILKFTELQRKYQLNEQREMWISEVSQCVQWYYFSAGNWEQFEYSVNKIIESAYQDKVQEFDIIIGGETYHINLLSREMKGVKTDQCFNIDRDFYGGNS